MKKILAILLACTMVFSLTACGGGKEEPAAEEASQETQEPEEAAQEEITLRLLSQTSDEIQNTILDDYIKAGIEEKFPNVTVKFEAGGGGDEYDNMLKTYSATGDLPDVWYSTPGTLPAIIDAGNALDMAEYITTDGFIEKFANPDALKDSKGGVYALSQGTDPMYVPVVSYNKEMFEQYGLEIPTTWDALMTVCDTLKANGMTPFAFGGGASFAMRAAWAQGLIMSIDPQVAIELLAGETDWSNPVCVEAYGKLKEMMDKGYFNDGYATTDTATAIALFTNGEAAMLFDMSWNHGNWSDETVGYFAFPSSNENYKAGQYIQYWGDKSGGYAVNANSANVELAVQLAEYCTECAARYHNEHGTESNLMTDVEIAEAAPLLAEANTIRKNAEVLVASVGLNTMDPTVLAEWNTMNTAFVAGGTTPEEFCNTFNEIYKTNTWFD